jgi:hypothetical protein
LFDSHESGVWPQLCINFPDFLQITNLDTLLISSVTYPPLQHNKKGIICPTHMAPPDHRICAIVPLLFISQGAGGHYDKQRVANCSRYLSEELRGDLNQDLWVPADLKDHKSYFNPLKILTTF